MSVCVICDGHRCQRGSISFCVKEHALVCVTHPCCPSRRRACWSWPRSRCRREPRPQPSWPSSPWPAPHSWSPSPRPETRRCASPQPPQRTWWGPWPRPRPGKRPAAGVAPCCFGFVSSASFLRNLFLKRLLFFLTSYFLLDLQALLVVTPWFRDRRD